MHRRHLIAALAIAALSPRTALAGAHPVPAEDAFLMLDSYLGLPPQARDRFSFVYRAVHKGLPATDAKAWLVASDGTRTSILFAPDRSMTNLPTLQQLKQHIKFEIGGPEFDFELEPRANIALANRIEVAAIRQSLAQLNAAIAKFAEGAPVNPLTAAFFPDAQGGQSVRADGSQKPLPTFKFKAIGPTAYYETRRIPDAVAVTFATPPSPIILAAAPR